MFRVRTKCSQWVLNGKIMGLEFDMACYADDTILCPLTPQALMKNSTPSSCVKQYSRNVQKLFSPRKTKLLGHVLRASDDPLRQVYFLNLTPQTGWTMVNGAVVVLSKTGCIMQRKPLMKGICSVITPNL